MLKKRFLWLIIIALVVCGVSLRAQEKAAAPAGPEKVMLFDGEQLKVQLEGRIRCNLVQTQNNVYQDTWALWVNNQKWGYALGLVPYKGTFGYWLPMTGQLKKGALLFDVRETALGLNIQGPKILGANSFAAIKIDFLGGYAQRFAAPTGGNVVRNPVPRIRNAYAGLEWKTEMFSFKFTFGQFNSLLIPVLAYPVNLSYLPYFEKGLLFNYDQGITIGMVIGPEKVNVMIDAAMVRATSGNDATSALYGGTTGPDAANIDERGTGEASMRPAWNGRIAFNLKPHPAFGLTLGVTGHFYNQNTYIAHTNTALYGFAWTPAYIRTMDVQSKSIGAQAKLQVWVVVLEGAGWMGQAMQNYYAMFGVGVRESLSGLKNLPDKGRGGYAQLYIALQKIGIPIMPYVGMAQEIKNNTPRIPYSLAAGATTTATYALSTLGAATTSTILWNSEVNGGIWIFFSQYMRVGFDAGQVVTKFKGVNGTSTSMVYRTAAEFVF